MIFNGPRLLFFPREHWSRAVCALPGKASWLIAGAVTAAIWPALAVVLSHLGSALAGREEQRTAMLRAAIGFTAAVGGALVMAPAYTLLLISLTRLAHEEANPSQAGNVALCLIWPTWATGLILAFPPLFNLGPEIGEALWGALALLVSYRLLREFGADTLGIRRRWRFRFIAVSTVAYLAAFVALSIAPAVFARTMLGASTQIEPEIEVNYELPMPAEPDW